MGDVLLCNQPMSADFLNNTYCIDAESITWQRRLKPEHGISLYALRARTNIKPIG